MTEKEFECYLILDYQKGVFRVVKSRKLIQEAEGSQIPIHLKIKVIMPERQILEGKGEVTLSERRVKEMIIENLEEKK